MTLTELVAIFAMFGLFGLIPLILSLLKSKPVSYPPLEPQTGCHADCCGTVQCPFYRLFSYKCFGSDGDIQLSPFWLFLGVLSMRGEAGFCSSVKI